MDSLRRSLSPSRRQGFSDAVGEMLRSMRPDMLTRMRTKLRSTERVEQLEKDAEVLRFLLDKDIDRMQERESRTAQSERKRRKQLKQLRQSAALRKAGIEAVMLSEGDQQPLPPPHYNDVETSGQVFVHDAVLTDQKQPQQPLQQVTGCQQDEEMIVYHARLQEQMEYWEGEARKQSKEARKAKAARLQRLQQNFHDIMGLNQRLRGEREQTRLRMQVEGPSLDPPVQLTDCTLGVYGTYVHSTSNAELVRSIDDVNVWSGTFDGRAEEQIMERQQAEAELQREEQLYSAITREMQILIDALEHLEESKAGLQKDLEQQQRESLNFCHRHDSQPHQEASAQDIQAAHLRHSRIVSLKTSLADCEQSIQVSRSKLATIREQERHVAGIVAALRERVRGLKASQHHTDLTLPVVLGRSIATHASPADTFAAAPRTAYDGVRLYSGIKLLQDQGTRASKLHTETKHLDRNLWLLRMKHDDYQQAFQHTLTNLVKSSERLAKSTTESKRLDVLAALRRFFQHEQQLYKVNSHQSGPLRWWKHRSPSLCKSVVQWSSAKGAIALRSPSAPSSPTAESVADFGISLGPAKVGFAMGVIRMPRTQLWRISVTVCSRHRDAAAGQDTNDSQVVVKFGSTLDALQTAGVVSGEVNPETGTAAWDVYYQFKGNRLAYRFEFRSPTADDSTHMAVLTGQYEQAELEPLQIVDYARGRVRSSLVTELVIEEQQGKTRLLRLMEELLSAEASSDTVWDSNVLNGVSQRYERNTFLKLIRAEILIEHNMVARVASSDDGSGGLSVDISPEQAAKLQRSEEAYRARKQKQQEEAIQLAMARIGKIIRMFDELHTRWRFVIVRDCTVRWVDNKTQALVLYVVQEVDKQGKIISGYQTVTLDETRFFEDPGDQPSVAASDSPQRASWAQDTTEIPVGPLSSLEKSSSTLSGAEDVTFLPSLPLASIQSNEVSLLDHHRERRNALVSAAKFSLETFARATPKSFNCEHIRAKAWGTAYGKGIRCVDCGKDLSDLHDEPSQIRGFGTGGDEWLDRAVVAHRKYDSTFKFESSAKRELVEEERLRLEKERREMELGDDMFLDFTSLKVLYDFDQRHQDVLRQNGVFRQGVQWTEALLDDYIRAQQEAHLRARAADGIMITAREARELVDLADLPPSTFRAQDEARKVAYEEMKWVMMRIRGFQSRVTELVVAKTELIADHHVTAHALQLLHSDAARNNASLEQLGIDLQMSAQLLQMAVEITRLLKHSVAMLRDAEHNEKLAELNFCDVQESARTIEEEAFRLRCELKLLLKEGHLLKSQQEVEEAELQFLRESEQSSRRHFEEAEENAMQMLYCCPGHVVQTSFGVQTIREFRFLDNIVVVELPFCVPPARAYLNARTLINLERARQQGERLGMEKEDDTVANVMRAERRLQRQEAAEMAQEDAHMREWLYYARLVEAQRQAIESKVEDAVLSAHQSLEGIVTVLERKRDVAKGMLKMVTDREKQLDLWTGTGPRPKLPNPWQRYKLRQQLNHEIRCRRLAAIAMRAEAEERQKLDDHQMRVLEASTVHALADAFMKEFIREIAATALAEGLEGTRAAELQSGIVFPSAVPMQYTVYSQLRDAWKARKEKLRRRIARTRDRQMSLEKPSSQWGMKTEQELLEELEEMQRAELERARQQTLCEEMSSEEERSRLAWRTEAIRSVSERREMAAEERRMRAHMAEVAAEAAMIDDEGPGESQTEARDRMSRFLEKGGDGYPHNQGFSRGKVSRSRARRREELMKSTVERRRQEIEAERMSQEDEYSKRMQRVWKEQDIARQYQNRAQAADDGFVVNAEWMQMLVEKLEFPENWEIMTMIQQNYWIETQIVLRKHRQRQQELTEKQALRMQQSQAASLTAWQQLYEARCLEGWNAELAWMHATEKLNAKKGAVKLLVHNLQKLELLLQERGLVSLKSQERWVKAKHLAAVRQEELDAARSWTEVCRNKLKQRKKIKRQIAQQCLWVDTTALSGFHQRYRTENLRRRIYDMYFQSLCQHILVRAEIVATERQLMRIQEGLMANQAEMLLKTKGLQLLWREFQTDQMLRLRRSALGRKLFGKWQLSILRESFSGWARYLNWQRGDREAFQLKYQLLRNEIDVQRAYEKQLLPAQPQPIVAIRGGTLMNRHKQRLAECKNCGARYLEGQNHSLACAYHPGELRVACPRSCPNPGRTRQCVAHKRKRWSCCDESAPDKPCARRSHVPLPTDPVYDKILSDIRERDKEQLAELDRELERLRQTNSVKQVFEIRRAKLKTIEDQIGAERQYLEKYAQLRLS